MLWILLIVGLVISFIIWILMRNEGEVLAVLLRRQGYQEKPSSDFDRGAATIESQPALSTAPPPPAAIKPRQRACSIGQMASPSKPARAGSDPAIATAKRMRPDTGSGRAPSNDDKRPVRSVGSNRAQSVDRDSTETLPSSSSEGTRRAQSIDRETYDYGRSSRPMSTGSDDEASEPIYPFTAETWQELSPEVRRILTRQNAGQDPFPNVAQSANLRRLFRRGVGGGSPIEESDSPYGRRTVGSGAASPPSRSIERPIYKSPKTSSRKAQAAAKLPRTRTTRHVSKSERLRLAKRFKEDSEHSTVRGPEQLAPSQPAVHRVRDAVDCSVFAPAAAPLNSTFLVQAFVHRPQQSKKVKTLATEFDPDASMRGFKSLGIEIERGTTLSLHLTAPGLNVDEPVQEVVWSGSPEAIQFAVTVPKSHAGGNIISTLTASLKGVPLGHIKFKVTINSGAGAAAFSELKPSGVSARHYRKAFISYASVDRNEVLKRVQMLSGLGITFFQDVLDLDPGSRWETEIRKHIDDCDLFLLFWSNASKKSTEVMKEIDYALKRKHTEADPPEIMPIPIEGPPPVPPPESLKHLHFNDYFLYFMR